MRIPHLNNSYKKGFNLVEAAIVLGVVGLVIGGIWAAASTVSENQKVAEAKAGIGSACENFKNLYAGQSYPNALLNISHAQAQSFSIFPSNWLVNNRLAPPWAGMTPAGATYDSPLKIRTDGSMLINIFGIKPSICRKLMASLANSTQFSSVNIGEGWWSSLSIVNLPAPIEASMATCNGFSDIHMEFICKP